MTKIAPKKRKDIYDKYRDLLENQNLSKKEIDEMRKHMIHLARAICEHVWGEDFY
jgi:hypothetical protein